MSVYTIIQRLFSQRKATATPGNICDKTYIYFFFHLGQTQQVARYTQGDHALLVGTTLY